MQSGAPDGLGGLLRAHDSASAAASPRARGSASAASAPRARNRGFALFWGAAALALLALTPFASKIAALPLACPFKSVTGLPCPTCGTLRAALSLARFDLVASVRANPLAAGAWIVVVAGGIVAALLALAGRPVAEPPSRLAWGARVAIVATLVANWVYLIARGA